MALDTLCHFINGERVEGQSGRFDDIFDPASGNVARRLQLASSEEVAKAVKAARIAQPAWAATNPQRRARVFMRLVDLIGKNIDALATSLSSEHGKTIEDAKGDIQRGLEVCEFVIGAPHLLKGEFTEGAGPAIDMYSLRQPVGIGAGITPFNFPAMVPLWMAAPAIACGNAFILKPSERDPSVCFMFADLFKQAGLPDGIFSIVNGDKEAVDAILTHPDIAAVSFVGSTPVAEYVYSEATRHGKRAQCFGGAKNHMIIMPDADMDQVANALIGAGYGSAGERCMAISVAVPVGEDTAERLIEVLKPRVEALKVGPYGDGKADFGPLITRQAKERVLALIEKGVEQGAKLAVDRRDLSLPQGYENGFFVGPCLFDHVTPEMDIYTQEIFGPVLSIVRAPDYEKAIELPQKHEYGNGVSIFTRDGDTARHFVSHINVGMVGVNVPIPVPLSYYSFGGWKKSVFGDLNQHGSDSFRFWTKVKTVTSRWPTGIRQGAEFSIPVMD